MRRANDEIHRNDGEEHKECQDDEGDVVAAEKVEAHIREGGAKRKPRRVHGREDAQDPKEALVTEQLTCKEGEHYRFEWRCDRSHDAPYERDHFAHHCVIEKHEPA